MMNTCYKVNAGSKFEKIMFVVGKGSIMAVIYSLV